MKIHSNTRELIRRSIEGSCDNILLFGSVARGDSSEKSDIDVLQLMQRRKASYKKGEVNVSVYDEPTLFKMAGQGSLFILHLKIDGKIITDKGRLIEGILNKYQKPVSYDPLRISLRRILMMLDIRQEFYFYRWKQCNELILYIVRTLLYAEYAEKGTPLFSLSQIAAQKGAEGLNEVMELKKQASPNWETFVQSRSYLEQALNCKAHNPSGNIEALLIAVAGKDPLLTALGLRLLSKRRTAFGYDLITSTSSDVS